MSRIPDISGYPGMIGVLVMPGIPGIIRISYMSGVTSTNEIPVISGIPVKIILCLVYLE